MSDPVSWLRFDPSSMDIWRDDIWRDERRLRDDWGGCCPEFMDHDHCDIWERWLAALAMPRDRGRRKLPP